MRLGNDVMQRLHQSGWGIGLAMLFVVTGCDQRQQGTESSAEVVPTVVDPAADPVAEQAVEAAGEVDFAREVLPILSNKCFACHGPDTRRKDLVRLDSFEAATRDLGDYHAIDVEDLADSEILFRINDQDDPMPPADAKPLSKSERDILERWVRQGGAYAKHWAFVPPTKQLPKDVSGSDAIDYAIGKQLRANGIDFANEADRATLARRASLVLTGLPPDLGSLDAFLKDTRPDAYERFVDTLLDNPRYGEHQARYWLDAVRYGDTHGLHLDSRRGIFPYRDWVVRAYNDNLPLDQFIQWQLAGDLFDHPTLAQMVATGYVRMNPTTAEGGAIPAEFQAKNNFDRVETLGTVMMGMTLNCVRCHTHKYDPITHTEYFEMLAFFNSTAENPLDGNRYDHAPTIKAPENQAAWDRWHVIESQARLLLMTVEQTPNADGQSSGDPIARIKTIAESDDERLGESKKTAQDLLKQADAARRTFTTTLIARDLPKPRVTKLLDRGEYSSPIGEPLSPSTFDIIGELPPGAPANRLGLAQWLTARDHPLTSRVFINRIWQRTFGYGLVRTPEDFGLQGEQSTHPELLDWLAVELQESGWDQKHMLKLMVTSRAFKQRSVHRSDVDDPENRLFARGPGHRLDAEEIRDMALWASGLLREEMGGPGIKPYQPSGMWRALAHPASNTKQYVQDTGDKPYRRSLYVYWKRTSPHPMMTLFDAPSREASCVRRSRSNTSLQSLALLNENQRIETARALAQRLIQSETDQDKRMELLFKLLASRSPSPIEREICMGLLKQMQQRYAGAIPDATALLAIGETPRDPAIDPVEHAAWTKVTVTVLASDVAIRLN